VCAELAPGGAPQQLLAYLATLKGSRVAIVGHEPDLSHLLELCLDEPGTGLRLEFKKLAVVGLRFARRPAPGAARLLWLLPPRLLRALR
jgi:phosphohistidine phosphatase SixA